MKPRTLGSAFSSLLAVAAAGCGAAPPAVPTGVAAEPPPVVVTVAPLGTRDVQREVAVVGTLFGFDEVVLAPKAEGRVRHVWVDTGDAAIPGAVLLELDPTDAELAVAEAKRALDAELARLGLSALPDGPLKVEDVPSVRKAEVTLANAKVRLDRVLGLIARQAASKEEADLAETDVKAADATKRDVIAMALATLASARLKQAALESAEQRVVDTRLVAPTPPGWAAWAAAVGPGFSPVRYSVASRMVTTGDMVRSMPVTNAFRLVIDSALKLGVAVPERYAADVKIGQPVAVRVDAHPGRTFAGVVSRISPTVDAQNRTFAVQVSVPNFDSKLKCGGFARAAIRTRVDPGVRTVPPHALVVFAGVTKVFVAENNRARAVEVTTGTRDKDWVEVLGDFPANATIVTSGLGQLVNGSAIRVRD